MPKPNWSPEAGAERDKAEDDFKKHLEERAESNASARKSNPVSTADVRKAADDLLTGRKTPTWVAVLSFTLQLAGGIPLGMAFSRVIGIADKPDVGIAIALMFFGFLIALSGRVLQHYVK
jgi:hypothetical protein